MCPIRPPSNREYLFHLGNPPRTTKNHRSTRPNRLTGPRSQEPRTQDGREEGRSAGRHQGIGDREHLPAGQGALEGRRDRAPQVQAETAPRERRAGERVAGGHRHEDRVPRGQVQQREGALREAGRGEQVRMRPTNRAVRNVLVSREGAASGSASSRCSRPRARRASSTPARGAAPPTAKPGSPSRGRLRPPRPTSSATACPCSTRTSRTATAKRATTGPNPRRRRSPRSPSASSTARS